MNLRKVVHSFGPLMFLSTLAAVAASGCGIDETTGELQDQRQALGVCTVSPVPRIIGYGQMGYHAYNQDGCPLGLDRCQDGLTPHNVDTRYNYARAQDGYFSCWYNTPDVICYSQPKIFGYTNVRQCYHWPDGTMTDYGCGCP